MQKVIHKFEFEVQPEFSLKLPVLSRILFVEKQMIPMDEAFNKSWERLLATGEGDPPDIKYRTCLWAELDPEETRMETRQFITVGTGHPYDSKSKTYIGSIMMEEDRLLIHVFERIIII